MTISRLSKTDVAKLLGCFNEASQTVNGRELRNGYFTDDVLAMIGISSKDYTSRKRFTHVESMKIIEVFGFDRADLESISKVVSHKSGSHSTK